MSVESLWNVYVTFGVSRGAQVKLTGLPDIMYLSSGVTVSPSEKIRTSWIYQNTHFGQVGIFNKHNAELQRKPLPENKSNIF